MDSVTWPERTFLPQYCYLASDVPPSSSIFLPQKTLPPPCCYLRELSLIHVLPCFRELSLFHALADVPVNKSSLGIHQIELVVQPSSQDFDYKNKIMFIVVSRQFCVTSSV